MGYCLSISHSVLEKSAAFANFASQFLKFVALIQALKIGLVLVQAISLIYELGCSQHVLCKTMLLQRKL
ncbi:MAG: hypothetical protein ACJA2D_002569 [Pseudohongiellaceae bacterium]|jgi:hypothetical protein